MNKRAVIISRDLTNRNYLTTSLDSYFLRNFDKRIPIQKFSATHELKGEDQIGCGKYQDVLVVLDESSRLGNGSLVNPKMELSRNFSNASFDLTERLCMEENIPVIRYNHKQEQIIKNSFLHRLDSLKPLIRERLKDNIYKI